MKPVNASHKKRLFAVARLIAGAVSFLGFALHAETLALYTFEGGVEGESVSRLENAVNPGTYDAWVHAVGDYGVQPCWTNNVPGNCVFSDSMCTQVISRLPMALRLDARDEPGGSGSEYSSGGVIESLDLTKRLVSERKFTVEFFARLRKWSKNGSFCSVPIHGLPMIFTTHPDTGKAFTCYTGYNRGGSVTYADERNGLLYYGTGKYDTTSVVDHGWQHFAMSVDLDSNDFRFYYRGKLIYTRNDVPTVRDNSYTNVVLGCDMAWNPPWNHRHNARIDVTCIRISNEVLNESGFMKMGAGAFYPFTDGGHGDLVTTLTNAFVSGSCIGTNSTWEGHTNASGVAYTHLKFNQERPGRYIFANAGREQLLCTEPSSIRFWSDNEYWRTGMGSIDFSELSGIIKQMSDTENEFTLECFYRHDFPHIAVAQGPLFSMTYAGGWQWNGQWRNLGLLSCRADTSSIDDEPNQATTDGEQTRGDGLWHHAAFVFTPSDKYIWAKNVKVYCDYASDGNEVDGAGDIRGASGSGISDQRPFADLVGAKDVLRIGRPSDGFAGSTHPHCCFNGYISCIRVVPSALTPDQFMVASDTLEKPGEARLRWRFDDGAGAIGGIADASGERWANGQVTTNGFGSAWPLYSANIPSRWIVDGGERLSNAKSAEFVEPESGGAAFLHSREWAGIPYLHPTNWTMEAFVRVPSAPTEETLLFGRGRYNPSTQGSWYDWALVVQTDGRLALRGSCSEGAYAYDGLGGPVSGGEWHHVALTYEASTHAYGIWVDASRVATRTLDGDQADTRKGRYHFGGGLGFGEFVGNVDEVRFSSGVLSVKDMLRAYYRGTSILVR